MAGETVLQMVQNNVRRGEDIILRHRLRLALLARDGHNTVAAETFVRVFEDTQVEQLRQLARMLGG